MNSIRVSPLPDDPGDRATELCGHCMSEPHDNWLGENGVQLCQMCWESYCSDEWWRVGSILEAVVAGDDDWLRDNGYLEAVS